MDNEDIHQLFDTDQVSRQLDLLVAKYLDAALSAYTGEESRDPTFDSLQMYSVSLKAAVAELIARNNRVLWHNVQLLFDAGDNEDSQA